MRVFCCRAGLPTSTRTRNLDTGRLLNPLPGAVDSLAFVSPVAWRLAAAGFFIFASLLRTDRRYHFGLRPADALLSNCPSIAVALAGHFHCIRTTAVYNQSARVNLSRRRADRTITWRMGQFLTAGIFFALAGYHLIRALQSRCPPSCLGLLYEHVADAHDQMAGIFFARHRLLCEHFSNSDKFTSGRRGPPCSHGRGCDGQDDYN